MQAITLEKIKGRMKQSGEDIYFNISIDAHTIQTQEIENAKKDF